MNCKQGTELIIEQMIDLLNKIDETSYAKPLKLFNGSTIGQHFRHILDFYSCLLKGVKEGRIDYAKRERDVLIETKPEYAKDIFNTILLQSSQLVENVLIEIVADFSSELNEARPVVPSSVARELMYAYDHAVHHLAMIKMGLKETCPTIEVNKEIGVAPSTVKHWKQAGITDRE